MINHFQKHTILFIVFSFFSILSFCQNYNEQQLDSLKQEATNCDSTSYIPTTQLINFYQYNGDSSNHKYFIDSTYVRKNRNDVENVALVLKMKEERGLA